MVCGASDIGHPRRFRTLGRSLGAALTISCVVLGPGFEPGTPTVSWWCSTAELPEHVAGAAASAGRDPGPRSRRGIRPTPTKNSGPDHRGEREGIRSPYPGWGGASRRPGPLSSAGGTRTLDLKAYEACGDAAPLPRCEELAPFRSHGGAGPAGNPIVRRRSIQPPVTGERSRGRIRTPDILVQSQAFYY